MALDRPQTDKAKTCIAVVSSLLFDVVALRLGTCQAPGSKAASASTIMMTSRERRCSLLALAALLNCMLLQHCNAETRICLNMIVKDEADEIGPALETLKAELSGWTICDTGV